MNCLLWFFSSARQNILSPGLWFTKSGSWHFVAVDEKPGEHLGLAHVCLYGAEEKWGGGRSELLCKHEGKALAMTVKIIFKNMVALLLYNSLLMEVHEIMSCNLITHSKPNFGALDPTLTNQWVIIWSC